MDDHEKLEKDIDNIVQKMIEKSEFLLKLSIPESWEARSQENNNDDDILLMRTTSDVAE
jgi:hypothetical protein